MKITEEHDGVRLTHEFEEMTPEKRPQDVPRNGGRLKVETLEHDEQTMPQALRLRDREGRSCIYVPAEDLSAEQPPQDPDMNGSELRFEMLEHGGEYPDDMPQVIRITDTEGRTCDYVPIEINGRVVDSKGFLLERLDAPS